ncbi:unnamed protein product, partial [Gongylonema pulchrum]|uniref:PAW domain-containing protein n=1 Tax=Gongylonema pulchrum TaxID=637853 RepID=A0A183D535_9BILA
MLFCRAVGLEVRLVYDVTDHVWCEIWSSDLDRWIHCDPCENVIDTPLLYERGWGKKLSYVVALGLDHITDVTWRYTYDHMETVARRKSCREAVLRDFVKEQNIVLGRIVTDERRKELERRCLKELIEFLSPNMQVREGSGVEEQGRTTGSEEWRKQRGEAGDSKQKSPAAVVLAPTEEEIANKLFSLEYDCAKDEYKRGPNVIKGWQTLVNKQENVCR